MTDKELLIKAKEHIAVLEAELTRLLSPPNTLGTICELIEHPNGERVLLATGGSKWPAIVLAPEDKALRKKLKPGVLVAINGAGAIVEVFEHNLPGPEVTVKRVLENGMLELEQGIQVYPGQVKAKAGDLVLLDASGTVALQLVKKDVSSFSVETATGVTWTDIGGQEEAKAILQEALEGPVRYASLYEGYGKRQVKGLLMAGPPGCGKTMLAKAAANSVREAHGKAEAETAFIYVKGPEVLNMWIGNTEAQIRGLFTRAREHKETHGYPAVIFIDEADAILGKRGSHHGSVLAATVVPTFLAEMDGMADSGAFVLLATNRPDTLDPAVVREGRIDRKVMVKRPDVVDTEKILRIHLCKSKLKDDIEDLAGRAAKDLFSERHTLYRVSFNGKGTHEFHIRHLVSGAMLAGVVDVAVSLAIQRDIVDKRTKPSGLMKQDMQAAIVQIVDANRNLNHDDDLVLFAESHGCSTEQIAAVQRVAA